MSILSSLSEAWILAPAAALALAGFMIGACIGSFLAVVLLRWPRGEPALGGRSSCEGCGRTLRMFELVPILSFLALRGRCARCSARIDSTQPLMEAGAGIVGLTAFLVHPGPAAMITALFGWWLLLLAALDARHHWLPDRLTLPFVPAGLAAASLGLGPEFGDRLIGAAAGFAALWTLAKVYRRLRGRDGLGGGDPKLLAGLGAWLGWQQLPVILLGSGLLGLGAVLLAMARGIAVSATYRLPLGALMALAAWPIWLLIAG